MRAPKTGAVFALLCLLTAWGAQAIEGDRHRYCDCGVNPNLPGADPHLHHLQLHRFLGLHCLLIPPPMLPRDNLDWKILILEDQRSKIERKIKQTEEEIKQIENDETATSDAKNYSFNFDLDELFKLEWTRRVVDSYLKLAEAEGIPKGSGLPEVPKVPEVRLKEEQQLRDYFEKHKTPKYSVSWKESKSGIIAAPMLGASVLLFISSAILMHKWILHRKSKAHSKK